MYRQLCAVVSEREPDRVAQRLVSLTPNRDLKGLPIRNPSSSTPEGTDVTIDDGPNYLPEPTPLADFGLNYWWHVASRGWVVHRYVMWSA